MKTRQTTIAALAFITGLTASVFVNTSYAITGIDLISQTHHVWGVAAGTLSDSTYDYTSSDPVNGSTSALWWDGFYTEENPGTNTETSFAGDFHVQAHDYSCDLYTESRCFAQSTYLFIPQTNQMQIQFTGEVAFHWFENSVSFWLVDTITNSTVDSQTWTTAYADGHGEVSSRLIDWTEDYAVTPGQEYALTLYAVVNVGDQPRVNSALSVNITPEPATLLLLGLGAVTLIRKH